jgi:hypothetical protein
MGHQLTSASIHTAVWTARPSVIDLGCRTPAYPLPDRVVLEDRGWVCGFAGGTSDDLMVLCLARGRTLCEATLLGAVFRG